MRVRPRAVERIDRPAHLRAHLPCSCSAKRCSYSYSIVRVTTRRERILECILVNNKSCWSWQASRFDYEHEHRRKRLSTSTIIFNARTVAITGIAQCGIHWESRHGDLRFMAWFWLWRRDRLGQSEPISSPISIPANHRPRNRLRVSALPTGFVSPAYRRPNGGSTAQLRAMTIVRATISTARCDRSVSLNRSDDSASQMLPPIRAGERVSTARRVTHHRHGVQSVSASRG